MLWRRLLTVLELLLVGLLFVTLVAPEWPAFQDEEHQLHTIVGLREFDFLVWEANALTEKVEALLGGGHHYLDRTTRKETVLTFLDLVREGQILQREINAIYADPDVADPEAATRTLRAEWEEKRAVLAKIQPVAEAILQEQVASILIEEGFDVLNTAWPPVQMHMTPLPSVLIVSPREEIRQIYNVPLEHGLSVRAQEALEESVLATMDRSALVVPIGGLGIYPAMIIETSSINYLANTIAHEWAHHWLTLHPLGASYAASPTLRTMNETVASIFGDEVGARVIERYYPAFIPEEPPPKAPAATPTPDEPPPFDFREEMAETRVRVDELLAEGKVAEAEAYMEQRRQVFVDNGYNIRKLNQAYFAFYGAYADTPGATGGDPIGPTLVTLREQSPSLRAFMVSVAGVTSFDAVEELLAAPVQ